MSDSNLCPVCSTWAGSLDPAALAGHRPHCPLGEAEADYAHLQEQYERAIEAHGEEERLHWNAVAATERVEARLTAAVAENERLHRELTAFADRIAAQAALLAANAERDALARLEAWQQVDPKSRDFHVGPVVYGAYVYYAPPNFEAVRVPCSAPINRVRVGMSLGCHTVAYARPPRHEDRPFSDKVVFVGTDDAPASLAACILAALQRWLELYGEQKGGT